MSDSPPSPAPQPLYYTFGNHMHWVDMQWLWGYDVLPGSVRDMLTLIRETGAKGNVNFDGIGYEKMAAECPEALADLRAAVQAGDIEPVGCSYGQPYGLFHGLESNIRQLTYGVRSVMRLLGVRPRTFWEEEFYFLPQLPQILRGCGYDGACLFFQWTWHTPEVPKERASLIQWEGVDGSRLPTLPRNELNVHQWPEDFDGLLEGELLRELAHPAVVQWLELMPSRDWMCRSEVLLPRLKELMQDERFEVRPRTCAGLIEELQQNEQPEQIPVRRYGMHEVWHGMTLGKNGDQHPRESRQAEELVQKAEAIAALAGLFGRPYPSWDVYPTWELEEAWRELLSSQHHDNHECEGLCGAIGYHSMRRAGELATEVSRRSLPHFGQREGRLQDLRANGRGWPVPLVVRNRELEIVGALAIPPFGFGTCATGFDRFEPERIEEEQDRLHCSRGEVNLVMDREQGVIERIGTAGAPDVRFTVPFPVVQVGGQPDDEKYQLAEVNLRPRPQKLHIGRTRQGLGGVARVCDLFVGLYAQLDAVEVQVLLSASHPSLECRPQGLNASEQLPFAPDFDIASVLADTPGSVYEVGVGSSGKKKYPSGDWMTSPQWFEDIQGAFTSFSFVDLLTVDGSGLLIMHVGSQQWFRDANGVRAVVTTNDPWDNGSLTLDRRARTAFVLLPHAGLSNAERIRLSRSLLIGGEYQSETKTVKPSSHFPMVFGPLSVENAPNVLAHAFFRESMKSGEHLSDWAGHRMFAESNGACDHPYVVRLVEWDGEPAEVTLKLAGDVALAAKTNLMGEVGGRADGGETRWLTVESTDPPDFAKDAKFNGKPISWSQVRFRMRPHEIATIMADLVMGRKEWRDLDAKREVWATVHRQDEQAE